jgi:hypothetical protein
MQYILRNNSNRTQWKCVACPHTMPPSCFVAEGTFSGNPNKYINPKFGF